VGVLAFLSPCLLFIWLLYGRAFTDELSQQLSFRHYPGAQWVSRTNAYYCCDSERRIQYYWTEDTIADVRSYYQTFALPFINNVTMFHPSGGELKLGYVPYPVLPEDEVDLVTDRECHFSQKYTSFQVQLISLAELGEVNLPNILAIDFPRTTPLSPLDASLNGRTLLIYSYYVDTDF
jgi:hypothetical protein